MLETPMIDHHAHPMDVLKFAMDCAEKNVSIALVIVTAVTGGAMRAPGALMVVTAAGETRGYVSNGCVDGDIVIQAQQALAAREMRQVAYGEGASIKDVKLPCGGRIELLVLPRPDTSVMAQMADHLESRQSIQLTVDISGNMFSGTAHPVDAVFTHTYSPKLRLRLAGRGEILSAVARLARQAGCEVKVYSPAPADLPDDLDAVALRTPDRVPDIKDDPWTAVILLFHDHDWEPELLKQALRGQAFYIGALGSRNTHAARLKILSAAGISDADLSRIHGPIGLVSSLRDADFLAVSVLAEIIAKAPT